MARRVFYSFHYKADNWRASQVRNMGVVSGNRPATDNDWEAVKRGGDPAIERWIRTQLHGKSCTVVLIGEKTAGRKWITFEIKESWRQGMGVLGIHVHKLKDRLGRTGSEGSSPFTGLSVDGVNLSSVLPTHDPAWFLGSSTDAYRTIAARLPNWIEEAIRIRSEH
ncbi:MAG: TIR domain-containing protein [Flavobacteriales bacterium]|nr:TIR domain-containing protein [Flavobacteriales bacterium]